MPTAALRRALTEPGPRPLPDRAADLLTTLDAPPRLAAHLRAVHDVAVQLVDWVALHHPTVEVDREAALFGAATHDIGKTLHPDELSGPGSAHEQAGYELLRAHGVDERLARFARDHASWTGPHIGFDDLLVSLADKVWKAKRVPDLEQRVVDHLAAAAGQQPWEAFLALDDFLDTLAADADSRLAYQASHPIAV
ncbi:HDIG domain-containing protein [Actinokineospora alba]|uniref:HDIG domain-containing protein n=1 Tax=Actinokineospora alba TaxID=504798 RepID=A0A1H0KBP9_9PSEU|nr:HD domain-containing protein [Actinokineospora alba]TDP67964.1 putative nucleotidyltransferase with HDIG domain [Actinokineospora alba]SDH89759.1 HDIG domain-containing protein [Actinokineospora alba]SDO53368.1 HDIG domain-containing protein [Actinokineospora alba]